MPGATGSITGRRVPTTGLPEDKALQTAAPLRAFGVKRSSSSRIPHLWAPSGAGSSQVWVRWLRRIVWSAAATVVTATSPAPTVRTCDVPAVAPVRRPAPAGADCRKSVTAGPTGVHCPAHYLERGGVGDSPHTTHGPLESVCGRGRAADRNDRAVAGSGGSRGCCIGEGCAGASCGPRSGRGTRSEPGPGRWGAKQ